jgi:hypothetical protein
MINEATANKIFVAFSGLLKEFPQAKKKINNYLLRALYNTIETNETSADYDPLAYAQIVSFLQSKFTFQEIVQILEFDISERNEVISILNLAGWSINEIIQTLHDIGWEKSQIVITVCEGILYDYFSSLYSEKEFSTNNNLVDFFQSFKSAGWESAWSFD